MSVMRAVLVIIVLLIASVQCTKSIPSSGENSKIVGVELIPRRVPAFSGNHDNVLYDLKIKNYASGSGKISLQSVKIQFTGDSKIGSLASVSVVGTDSQNPVFGLTTKLEGITEIAGNTQLADGTNFFTLHFVFKSILQLTDHFDVQQVDLTFSDHTVLNVVSQSKFSNRPTILLRSAGQDQVNTYRIPGLTTTNKGTLIAVYDNRYLNSGDLQGDIDVGMSRSTDGGQSWSPMRKVLDMGDFGGLTQEQNGIGDPCVLVDNATNTIWVAGLWVNGIPGQTAWNGSKPGMKPGETGQFVMAKSEDDGLTWSPPISITEQCKNPAWNLFFQGPGRGITLTDGTLVFPAQFKDDQKIPYSTLIYSKDHGKTWHVGTGAKSNTTESQVVQLTNGSLMLNMRDDRNKTEKGDNNGRAVSITNDLGQTWTVHNSSNSALPESNCQASILAAKVLVDGVSKDVLFFSNPNDKISRAHLTIKASLDQGTTWPVAYQIELNSADSFGYSCLTMVNDQTVGILYEGTKDLYFQEIGVDEIFKK